ncbi:MAG: hypothetical protein JWO46_826 [Nocardioidaceae bacterium]|nr:hypothetical protein [Nocardioidaceae bacterium]
MGFTGGAPQAIGTGGRALTRRAKDVASRADGVRQARSQGVGGSGGSPVGAALQRFAAAYATFDEGVGAELRALGTLADHTGQDIEAAGCAPGGVL